ncbi:MAG: hypothetical protein K2H64_02435 [Desulfovibrio sp.]|nr:hypothetical protein [Desulfovibrio sp.]
MKIPLISKKRFNRFKKLLPVPRNAEKIPAIIVIICALGVIRYGRSWGDTLVIYEKYNSILKRFSRWSKNCAFRDAFKALAAKVEKRNTAMIDSTIIKVYRTAASMKRERLLEDFSPVNEKNSNFFVI